jgi:hypothetical protein
LTQEGRRIDSQAGREHVGENVRSKDVRGENVRGRLGDRPHASDDEVADEGKERRGMDAGAAGLGVSASGEKAEMRASSARVSRGGVAWEVCVRARV